MKQHSCESSDAERCEAVMVLQPAEFALDGDASAVEIVVPLSVASDSASDGVARV